MMKKNTFLRLTVALLFSAAVLTIATPALAWIGEGLPLQQSILPQITYLGQGPQTFTVEPPLEFLVKTYQNGQFLFVTVPGPTYEAESNERVWTTDFLPDEPFRLFHESRSYGQYAAGCVVNYVQIEDNVDTRRNTFYINGKVLQVVEQGMVTYGSFVVPEDGELTFYAEDSIGLIVTPCQSVPTAGPSETPTATETVTNTPSPTFTSTPTPAPTATDTLAPSDTPTSTQTATLEITAEPSSTVTPGDVILPSDTPTLTLTSTLENTVAPSATITPGGLILPSSTPTASLTPELILITATPVSTPGAIPITGGGPTPAFIAAASAAILGLFGLLGAAWWLLLRAYRHDR
jgi:hypothetical protein